MANIIETIYSLKDGITAGLKKITGALRDNRAESDKTADATERNNARASASYKKTAQDIGDLRKALAAVAAFVGLSKVKDGLVEILNVGERFDDLEKEFASAFGGLDEGTAALEKVRAIAANVPQSLEDVSAAAIALKRAGFDPLDGSLQALIDNQNALGQSQEDLIATIEALGRANVKGQANIKTLTALSQQGIPVFDLLGKAMGASSDRVRELAESGRLGQDAIRQLVAELGKLRAGASADELGDLDSQFTKLKDAGREFLNTIAKSGALDFFREKLKDLNAEVSEAAKSGKLQELAKSISDGIVNTATAIGNTIGLITKYSGALLALGRAYAVFKTADFLAGIAKSATILTSAGAAAKKASGDVDVTAGAFGRLRGAIGKIPANIQFAIASASVDFTINALENLIDVTKKYMAAREELTAKEADYSKTQEDLESKARRIAEVFKDSASIQIASADELADKSRLQSAAYVESLQNAIRYFSALRILQKAQGDDDSATKTTAKLNELRIALDAARTALTQAGGAIAASTGEFARSAVKDFETARAAGHDTADALRGIFDKVDLGTPKGARDVVEAIAVIGPRAKEARDALQGELLTALQKVDGQTLRNFQTSATEAFADVGGSAKDLASVMEASLDAALTRLGVSANAAGISITTTGRDIIATFKAVVENVTASGEQIEQALEAAVGKAQTKDELEALGAAFKAAATTGKLSLGEIADAGRVLEERMRTLNAAVSPLQSQFDLLGIKSQASLLAARDNARAAFDAIVQGAREGTAAQEDVARAFKVLVEAERAAAADSDAATRARVEDQLELKASVLGLSDSFQKAGDAGKRAGHDIADGMHEAADAAGDAADAIDKVHESAERFGHETGDEFHTRTQAWADSLAQAATNAASAKNAITLLTNDQLSGLKLLGQELAAGGLSLAQYEERLQEVMTGTSAAIERQIDQLARLKATEQDLLDQIAQENGDSEASEDARHRKALDDIKAEATLDGELNVQQYNKLKQLEDQLHALKMKNIAEQQQQSSSTDRQTSANTDNTSSTTTTQRPGGAAASVSNVFNVVLLSGDKAAVDQLGDLVARRVDQRIKEIARRSL